MSLLDPLIAIKLMHNDRLHFGNFPVFFVIEKKSMFPFECYLFICVAFDYFYCQFKIQRIKLDHIE